MSQKGIQIAAQVFSHMQEARGELFRLATKTVPGRTTSRVEHQDVLLAQMFERAKEHIKDDFNRITMMKE